jgi:cell wall hydrolase
MEISRRRVLEGAAGAAAAGVLTLASAAPASAAYPTLRRGSTGSAVRTLQSKLNYYTYWCGTVDGIFGNLTEQAVFAIQKAAGITRDGIVGPITWSKVLAGVRPTIRSTSGTVVEIHKGRQLLKVASGGRLALTLNTSTGSGTSYYSGGTWHIATTPSGTFSIYRRVNGWDYGPLGSLWRPAYFNGGIAVHGYSFVPPYPASHGCVRVSIPAMNMLWSTGRVPVGRRVLVY